MSILLNRGYGWATTQGCPGIIPWNRSTHFNRAHPLANNCVFLAVYNQLSLEPYDLRNLAAVPGHENSVAAISGGTSIVPFQGHGNRWLDFSGDANADRIQYGTLLSTDRASLSHTNQGTVMWQGYNDGTGTTPSAFPHVICSGQGSGGSGGQDWRVYHDRTNNSINWDTSVSKGTGTNSFIEGDSQDRPYVFAIVRDADNIIGWSTLDTTTQNVSMNVVGTNTGAGTSNFPHTAGNELVVANWAGGSTDRNWEGKLGWVAMWDRALTADEINYIALHGGIQELALGYNMAPYPIFLEGATAPGGGGGGGGRSFPSPASLGSWLLASLSSPISPATSGVATAGGGSPPAVTNDMLLSGDMQSGTDKLLLSGDAQSGTDTLMHSGT